jgi:SAM-dependent methyltransferase
MPTSRTTEWVAEEFDRRAATYDESRQHVWQAELAAQLLDPQPEQRILDIATGTGMAATAVSRLTSQRATVVGIDVSQQMLQIAVAKSDPLSCHYLRADAYRLPFRQTVFDALLCVSAIPYLADLGAAVAEWCRVARPKAALVFSTPAADGLMVHRLLRQAAKINDLDMPDPHAPFGTPISIRAFAESFGLVLTRIERHTFPQPLDDNPRDASNMVINYGFADPVRTAPDDLREAIFDTYAKLHHAAHQAGDGVDVILFGRCQLP